MNSVAPRDAPGDKLSAQSLQALASKLGELIPESNSSGQVSTPISHKVEIQALNQNET